MEPPTQAGLHATLAPGQLLLSTQLAPALGPPSQAPTLRAARRIVYAASAEPKSVMTFIWSVTVASASGSKMGGSRAPSGVNEPKATFGGVRKVSGDFNLARRSRGTGTLSLRTRMPDQLTGMRRLPAASTATRIASADAVQGASSKQSA